MTVIRSDLRYARAGGPPTNWDELIVWDLDKDREVHSVIEADLDEGWVRVYADRGIAEYFGRYELRVEHGGKLGRYEG